MELGEKTLSSKLVYDGGLLKVYYDTVELVNGSTSWREVVRHPGAVVMVPVDDDGNVYLVRQYRYPYGKTTLEVPAGKLEYGEEPLPAAQRELEEEIGAHARQWTSMGEMLPTPASATSSSTSIWPGAWTSGKTIPMRMNFWRLSSCR